MVSSARTFGADRVLVQGRARAADLLTSHAKAAAPLPCPFATRARSLPTPTLSPTRRSRCPRPRPPPRRLEPRSVLALDLTGAAGRRDLVRRFARAGPQRRSRDRLTPRERSLR